MRLAWLGLFVALSGCASHYSGGPTFSAVRPEDGLAVVYAYRPGNQFGAATFINVDVYGRKVDLCSNSFAAFVVPAGKLTAKVRILSFTNLQMVDGVGYTGIVTTGTAVDADKGLTPVDLDAVAGESYFVRVEFDSRGKPPSAKLVSSQQAMSDLGGLHMIPGGRARWPVVLPQ